MCGDCVLLAQDVVRAVELELALVRFSAIEVVKAVGLTSPSLCGDAKLGRFIGLVLGSGSAHLNLFISTV